MRRLLTLTLLALAPLLAIAEDARTVWQLDLIVFERDPEAQYGFAETWTFKPIEWPETLLPIDLEEAYARELSDTPLYVKQAAKEAGIHIRASSASALAPAAGKLERSAGYRLIAQHSLRFEQKTKTPKLRLQGLQQLRLAARDTRGDSLSMMDYWLSEPDRDPPVDAREFFGWVQLDHQIHPILQFDLRLLKVLPGIYPNLIDPDGRHEYFRDQVQQFRMRDERRLRPGMTAYFDHQRLGLLARLTEIQLSKPDQPANAAAGETP